MQLTNMSGNRLTNSDILVVDGSGNTIRQASSFRNLGVDKSEYINRVRLEGSNSGGEAEDYTFRGNLDRDQDLFVGRTRDLHANNIALKIQKGRLEK